jgi:hypothetical protein
MKRTSRWKRTATRCFSRRQLSWDAKYVRCWKHKPSDRALGEALPGKGTQLREREDKGTLDLSSKDRDLPGPEVSAPSSFHVSPRFGHAAGTIGSAASSRDGPTAR